MSLPPADFDQFSSLSLAKAASKKRSQAKWYQKNKEHEQQQAHTRAAYKREKIQSKVESNVTTRLTHTLSQHGGGSAKGEKKRVVQRSILARAQRHEDYDDDIPIISYDSDDAIPITPDYTIATRAQQHEDYDDDDDIPIASYDSDDPIPTTMPIASLPHINYRFPSSSSHGSRYPSPDLTPKSSQQQRVEAMQRLPSIANIVFTWNSDWGPISNWSPKFAKDYLSAVDENKSTAFIEAVAKQVQVGQQLMDNITHVITDCTLPTSENGLKAFVQLMLKLIFRLNKGILVLEDRVRLVSSFLTN